MLSCYFAVLKAPLLAAEAHCSGLPTHSLYFVILPPCSATSVFLALLASLYSLELKQQQKHSDSFTVVYIDKTFM